MVAGQAPATVTSLHEWRLAHRPPWGIKLAVRYEATVFVAAINEWL
ncbi:hypothetical protein [Streptomyces sp. NPDC048196]